jgi:hypothetical protein
MVVRKHILVLNRWCNPDFTRYHEYIDHQAHAVSYITTSNTHFVPRGALAAGVYVVDNLDIPEPALGHARAAVAAHGKLDAVVALAEEDQEQAAAIREQLGVDGARPAQARLHRDKVAMKQRLQASGVRAPRFTHSADEAEVLAFARRTGFPVMLKPRDGLSSSGVFKVHSDEELLERVRSVDLGRYECEEYIAGRVLHADGLVKDGAVVLFKPFAYLGSCYEFATGEPLGCVTIDDPMLHARVRCFTEQVLKALEHPRGAFHLELFLDRNDELVFLELGARAGGGEIPYLFRDVFGAVLVDQAVRIEMGEWRPTARTERQPVAGGLLFPAPRHAPCRVVDCQPPGEGLFTLYRAILPEAEDEINDRGGYGFSSMSGMLLFAGQSTREVTQDIRRAVERFAITSVPLGRLEGAASVTRWSWPALAEAARGNMSPVLSGV